jgi:ribosome-binding protein aMBF1 (putative translation factor)
LPPLICDNSIVKTARSTQSKPNIPLGKEIEKEFKIKVKMTKSEFKSWKHQETISEISDVNKTIKINLKHPTLGEHEKSK